MSHLGMIKWPIVEHYIVITHDRYTTYWLIAPALYIYICHKINADLGRPSNYICLALKYRINNHHEN